LGFTLSLDLAFFLICFSPSGEGGGGPSSRGTRITWESGALRFSGATHWQERTLRTTMVCQAECKSWSERSPTAREPLLSHRGCQSDRVQVELMRVHPPARSFSHAGASLLNFLV
jgi:hypothetical protein